MSIVLPSKTSTEFHNVTKKSTDLLSPTSKLSKSFIINGVDSHYSTDSMRIESVLAKTYKDVIKSQNPETRYVKIKPMKLFMPNTRLLDCSTPPNHIVYGGAKIEVSDIDEGEEQGIVGQGLMRF